MPRQFAPGELKDWPLARAARENDEATEQQGLSLPNVFESRGLDLEKTIYLADQRALMTIMRMEGRPMPAHATPVRLDLYQRSAHTLFQAAYLDGMLIGWYGHQLALVEEDNAGR